MSRLYIIIALSFLFGGFLRAQSNLGNYLKYAEEKYNKGDFFYAAELYQKAMQIDSNSVAILWKYAETLRAYKDYRKAEYYYSKIYEREEGGLYPMSLLNLGLMQKQNGKYDAALETFKKVKSNFSKDKKNYIYIKAKREMESCLWAKSNLSDTANVIFTHLSEKVNTKDSEFGHALHENNLIFSSLRADSVNRTEEVYATSYKTKLFKSKKENQNFADPTLIKEVIFKEMSSGNGAYSKDGTRFYFSLCKDDGFNYRCKIMVANYANGRVSRIDSLGTIINSQGSNNTMPYVTQLGDEEVLFFASDREGGAGGMDIWYSVVKNGNQYSKPINIKTLNSVDNEICPWYDTTEHRLYFSSSWHDGYGGYDIFTSEYREQFSNPENIGQPYNSPANDTYFFKDLDTAYFTSNRIGVYFSKNPTCCTDIFSAYPIPPPVVVEQKDSIQPKKESLAELSKRLPVTLYFHNDCPDPKSRDTLTHVNYISGYSEYRAMLDKYQTEYSTGLEPVKAEIAKEDIENFFIEYVDQGVKDLELFRDLLLEELKNGSKINLTVKGFASPLAKTDYNVNLTKRRISSLVNYLREFDNGVFAPYLDGNAANGGKVQFTQVPFGEYTANKLTSDNFHDQKNSVYSRSAAIERKIEIQSIDYIKEDSLLFITSLSTRTIDLAKIGTKDSLLRTIEFTNKSALQLEIERIEVENNYLIANFEPIVLPNNSIRLNFSNSMELPKGLFSFYAKLYVKGFTEPLLIMINGEGQ